MRELEVTIEIEVSDEGPNGERLVTNTSAVPLEVVPFDPGRPTRPLPPGAIQTLQAGDSVRQAPPAPTLASLVDARNRVRMIRRTGRAFPATAFVHPFTPEQLETIALVLDAAVDVHVRAMLTSTQVDEALRMPDVACRVCGCTEKDCGLCVERTGSPCRWVEPDLCSACAVTARITGAPP